MHLTVEQTFPASVEHVAAMLADADYIRWRAERTTGRGTVDSADVDLDGEGGFTILIRRTLPTDVIPAQARHFVGDRVEIRQAEVWEPAEEPDRRVGTVALEITGAPVFVTGTVTLQATDDGGTRKTYDGDVRATVPLFASLVESAAISQLRRTLATEEAAGREWLAGAGSAG